MTGAGGLSSSLQPVTAKSIRTLTLMPALREFHAEGVRRELGTAAGKSEFFPDGLRGRTAQASRKLRPSPSHFRISRPRLGQVLRSVPHKPGLRPTYEAWLCCGERARSGGKTRPSPSRACPQRRAENMDADRASSVSSVQQKPLFRCASSCTQVDDQARCRKRVP